MSAASGKTPVSCPQCGKDLMVPVAAVGKQGRCPACAHQFLIEAPIAAALAAPDLVELPDDDLPQLAPLADDSFGLHNTSTHTLQPVSPALASQFSAPAANQRSTAINPYMASAAADMQRAQGEKYSHGFGLEQRAWDMGMLGGILMMGIAAVWFFAGLAAGYIFFYPPILFVIGLAAFCRGMFTSLFNN